MLFVTVSELRDRFPGCEILFLSPEKRVPGYDFTFFYDYNAWESVKGGMHAFKSTFRIPYWRVRGKRASYGRVKRFKAQLESVDAFVDISGYALSSQRGEPRSVSYLDQIKVAKKFNKPYFIMPQSIGPFDYHNKAKMDAMLKEYLPYPVIIYPREEDGYRLLTEQYGLKNVKQSFDLVLQNKTIKEGNIFTAGHRASVPVLPEGRKTAVIPNMRNFEFADRGPIIKLYKAIIEKLQSLDRKVYLMRHSTEDLEACQLIYDALDNKEGVEILENDFDCIEFGKVISQFDFIIGSRYHSIVHSLKNAVPAIVLGWAVKYQELLKLFEQERFLFDVRDNINTDEVLAAIDDMNANYEKEHEKTGSLLENYQQENCYDVISEYFKDKAPAASTAQDTAKGSGMGAKSTGKKVLEKVGIYKSEMKKKSISYLETYTKYSFSDTECHDPEQYEAVITRWYHTIEKGLAYTNFRAGFGKDNIEKMLTLMEKYSEQYDTDKFFYRTALSCMHEYIRKNEAHGYTDEALNARVAALKGERNDAGGVVKVQKTDPEKLKNMGFEEMLHTRHSIREFSEEPVDLKLLVKAVELAQLTPSACNRQGWKTRIIANRKTVGKVLENQFGNRGFGEGIDKLLLVTCDIRYFNKYRELFQPYIDGGMYAENIINSLYYHGIGSIPLSASLNATQEANVRRILGIKEHEVFIMFIGAGNYPDECLAARSERKPEANIEVIE